MTIRKTDAAFFHAICIYEIIVIVMLLLYQVLNVCVINTYLEWVVGTGWSWLRIGTGGGHLWVR